METDRARYSNFTNRLDKLPWTSRNSILHRNRPAPTHESETNASIKLEIEVDINDSRLVPEQFRELTGNSKAIASTPNLNEPVSFLRRRIPMRRLIQHQEDSVDLGSRAGNPLMQSLGNLAKKKGVLSKIQSMQFLRALLYCFYYTPPVSILLKESRGPISQIIIESCSRLEQDTQINVLRKLLQQIEQQTEADTQSQEAMLDTLFKLLRTDEINSELDSEQVNWIDGTIGITERTEISHPWCCKYSQVLSETPCFYLKLPVPRQYLNLQEQFSSRYRSTNVPAQQCPNCHVRGKRTRRNSLGKLGPLLIIMFEGGESRIPDQELTITQNMMSRSGKEMKELVYTLTGAVRYENGFDRNDYCGYFFKNNWHSVNDHGIKEVNVSDLKTQSFFLLFYSQIRDSSHNAQLSIHENDQLAIWSHASFYYTTLSCLLLTNSFLRLCSQSKESNRKDLSSTIAVLMESDRVQKDPAYLFDKVWENFYQFEKELKTPTDFLRRLLEKIDPKLVEDYFEVWLKKVSVWKNGSKVLLGPNLDKCKTLRLPIPGSTFEREEEVWYFPDEFYSSIVNRFYTEPTDQGLQQFSEALRQVNPVKPRVKSDNSLTVMKCLKYKLRTIGREENVILTPKANKPKQIYEQKFLRHIGDIVIVEFYYLTSLSKNASVKLSIIERTLDLKEFLPSAQNYQLRAIIKQVRDYYTAYIKINCKWYTLIDSNLKLVDFPSEMTDVHMLIYEISTSVESEDAHESHQVPIKLLRECLNIRKIMKQRLKGTRVIKTLLSKIENLHRWNSTIEHKALSTWHNQIEELKISDQNKKQFLENADSQHPKHGIPNLGNSCFMSAVLNCLFYTNPFLSLFMNKADFMRSNLASSVSLFCDIYQQRSLDSSIKTVLQSVLRESGFSEEEESCPHLFLTALLSKLQEEEFSGTQGLRNIVSVSEYQISTCTKCYLSRFFPTLNWTLVLYPQVGDQRNVDELLQEKYFLTTESTKFGEECKCLSTRLFHKLVDSVSPVLVLFLDHSASGYIRVRYEQELDFNKYLPVSGIYRLYAIVTLLTGRRNHAIAYIKLRENWYSFNDEKVRIVSLSKVCSSDAYMLLYERVTDSAMEASMSLRGLPNLGNTDFMNSLFTSLFYIPRLRGFLSEPKKHQITDFALRFSSFMREPPSRMSDLLRALLVYFPDFKDGEQHCAHSFFLRVLKKLDEDLNCENELRARQIYKCVEMHKMFYILSERISVCCYCFTPNRSHTEYTRTLVLPIPLKFLQVANTTVFTASDYYASSVYSKYARSFDNQNYVSALRTFDAERKQFPSNIPIVNYVDLSTCLRFVYRTRLMDVWNMLPCSHCKRDTRHLEQLFLRDVGSVLVIQLDRYSEGKNIAIPVRFPYVLDLQEFLHDSKTFKLTAIINHFGDSLHEGHYTTYVNMSGSWYSFDDMKIESVSAGPGLFEHAYLLIYEET